MKNANFMASLKAFFSKAWTATKAFSIKAGKWIVANKLISIPVAVVLVGGIACAIALPIALHEHDFATEWSTDANNHWHSAICSHEEEKSDLGAHAYDNACDTTCNVCGATRTVGAHAYDNDCDTTCNTCGATRTVGAHAYDNACDTTCNTCGATRTVGAHVYDNACDTTCNACGATRAITHDHADTLTAGDTTHYYLCSVCGDKKDEVAHVFDKTVASSEYLKAAATATTKAQYYKSCVCGKASATEYFETDKAPANLQVADISKTYDGTPVAEPTVTFDGVGAENFAYYKGNEKLTERPTDAGTYKVVVTVDETDTHVGERVEREFTIAKKVLSNVKASVIYDGSTTFGEITLAHDGIVAGDVIIADIDVANKNVGVYTGTGAAFTILDALGNGAANYEINEQTTEVTVTPKTLNYLEITKVYNGKEEGFNDSFGRGYALGTAQGVIAGDEVILGTNDDVYYNVGTYVLSDSNGDWGLDDSCYLVGDDKDNYQFNYKDNGAVATITVTPKTLNYLEITKVYDGEGVLAYALGTEHGVVAGDEVLFYCDEGPDYIVGTYNLIPYDDPTSIDDPGADDRALLAGADKANYKFAEQIEGKYKLCATITVTKRPVWAENVKFTYDGSTCWTGEESPEEIVFQNVVTGETIDSSYIEWEFRAKDVGSYLVSVDDGEYYANYDFDLSKCSASIVPRVIDNLTYAFEYNGMEYHQAVISKNEHSGIVGDDQISLEVCFATPNVGSALDTDGEFGFEPSFVEENYVLGENYNFSIIKKVVTELPATLTAEYKSIDGVIEGLEAPVEIDGIEATLIFVARKSDNNMLYNPGTYTNATIIKASLGDNFDLQIDTTAKYTITVAPKKLSALNIKITEAQYAKGEFTLVASKDGVYAPVNVTFSMGNSQDAPVGAVFELIIDEDLFMQGREVIAFADSGYAQAYQFVPDANGVVGTMTIVASCDVQYDGSCNCGTSHLTETLTFTGGEAVGASATIDCDSDYEGGIYKIALEGGKYEFSGSDDFFNIGGIYDVNGNTLATSIGTYILPKGTYYFHVYVGTSPSSDTIWVKKTAKILDAATMANAIVPDMEPGNSDVGVRIHNLQTHNGGDTFVLFYNVGENADALGHEINFQYEDGDGGYSATSNIESIEFYDVNGIQLNVTYDEPDMIAASGVTAVGGVYIVVTMNGEGMDNLYFYAY